MSHVCKVELKIKDLAALGMAAQTLGGELVRGQTHYNCYADHSPAYRVSADDGKCDHAIRIRGEDSKLGTHEIGVRKEADGSYSLHWDPMGRIVSMVGGRNAERLRQEYSTAVATKWYRTNGYRVTRKVKADGKIILEASK